MRSIAFMINQLGVGGAERVFLEDANMFARRGYRVLFFMLYGAAGQQPLAQELDPAIEQQFVRASGPFDLRSALAIMRILRKQETRNLISTLNDSNIMARWVAFLGGGYVHIFLREANDPNKKRWWQRLLSIIFDSVATQIIAVSEQTRKGMLRDAPWRRRKIIVLRNAVDLPTVPVSHNHEGAIRIVTVGSLTPQKDHATLITALVELKRRQMVFEARIVGSGPLESKLKEQAVAVGLSELVFVGKLSHAEALREYARADIFVLSSRWEGCPNVVLEAMAYGLPVVATDVGGVPELLENHVTGELVPPGDPSALSNVLRALIDDPELRDRMGSAALERIRAIYSPDVRFERLKTLLREPVPAGL